MKILFLDIDGVLNCRHTFQRHHDEWLASGEKFKDPEKYGWPLGHIDATLVARLNTICAKTDCHIVISSSWKAAACLLDLRGWLTKKGFQYPDRIIDKTPILRGQEDFRGREIQTWLDEHKDKEVIVYVILDDDSFDIENVHPKNFVHTSFIEGLQDKNVEQAIAILNR